MHVHAKLVALTQPVAITATTPEEFVAYAARVSNPSNQNSHDTASKLLAYCVRNRHWSVFEMVNAVLEVEAPRDITRQLLRHRSFSFQEFSQRYSDEVQFTKRDFRRQDTKNRQNSTDDLPQTLNGRAKYLRDRVAAMAREAYREMRSMDVAKECARVVLPEGLTLSRLYVNGTLRSWLHYLDVRDDPGVTQWEHVVLAREIRAVLEPVFPAVFGVLEPEHV
jgi:thymidylate synthase (FAD)